MLPLTRIQFLNHLLGDDDLRAIAEMWRGWHSLFRCNQVTGSGQINAIRLEIEIAGFATSEVETLRKTVDQTFAGMGPAKLRDGDTLVTHLNWTNVSQPSDVSPWTRVLALTELERSFIVLRVRIDAWKDAIDGKAVASNSLVLGGTPIGGKLLLKAVWTDAGGTVEDLHRKADWADQASFLAALEAYRQTEIKLWPQFSKVCAGSTAEPLRLACGSPNEAGDIAWRIHLLQPAVYPPHAARVEGNDVVAYAAPGIFGQAASHRTFAFRASNPFVSTLARRRVDRFLHLFYELPGRRDAETFFRRIAAPLLIVLASVCLVLWLPRDSGWSAMAVIAGCLAFAVLARVIWTKARQVVLYRTKMNQGLSALYMRPVEFERADVETTDLRHDPSNTKCIGDLESAGATHCFDFKIADKPDLNSMSRLFVLADACTSCILSLMWRTGKFELFPAKPLLLLETEFADGHRLVTLNSGGGFRKQRTPNVTVRVHLEVTHPIELLELHESVLQRLVAEGRTPVPPNAEGKFERMRGEHERARALYAKRAAYTWGDALHEAFKIVRKEYREPSRTSATGVSIERVATVRP